MTEQEAIELLRSMQNPKQDFADIVCAPAFCTGFRFVYPEPEDYAIEEAIKAIKEIQQYREIGTVEECQQAMEKAKSLDMYVKQVIWERDVAIQQLEEVGVSLGEKMDSVKEAVEKQKPKAPDYEGCYCSECVKKIRGSERNE